MERLTMDVLLTSSFFSLWSNLYEEVYEGTPEADDLSKAARDVARMYMNEYDLPMKMEADGGGVIIPRISTIENRILKRGIESISEDDQEHLNHWMGVLRKKYI